MSTTADIDPRQRFRSIDEVTDEPSRPPMPLPDASSLYLGIVDSSFTPNPDFIESPNTRPSVDSMDFAALTAEKIILENISNPSDEVIDRLRVVSAAQRERDKQLFSGTTRRGRATNTPLLSTPDVISDSARQVTETKNSETVSPLDKQKRLAILQAKLNAALAQKTRVDTTGATAVSEAEQAATEITRKAVINNSAAKQEAMRISEEKRQIPQAQAEEARIRGQSDAAKERQILDIQAENVRKYLEYINSFPRSFPRLITRVFRRYDLTRHDRRTELECQKILNAAEASAEAIIRDADVVINQEYRQAHNQADAQLEAERERARQLVAAVKAQAEKDVQAIQNAIDLLQEQISALSKPEVTDDGRTVAERFAGLEPITQTQQPVIEKPRVKSPPGQAKVKKAVSDIPRHRRSAAEWLTWRKSLAICIAWAAFWEGSYALLPSGQPSAQSSAQIDKDVPMPQWVPKSVRAWQDEIDATLHDPRVKVDGKNYLLGDGTKEHPNRTYLVSLMILLTSGGDYSGDNIAPNGLVAISAQQAEMRAKQLGVPYPHPTVKDAKNVLLIAEKEADDIVVRLTKDPLINRHYVDDPAALTADFLKEWLVNGSGPKDAQGLPNSVGLPPDFQTTFQDLANDRTAKRVKSQRSVALFNNKNWIDKFVAAEKIDRAAGVISPDEEN